MYRYDEFDHALVQDRVTQFRRQVERRMKGEISEEQFRPLRLMNGLYLQLHAYMLRVAIPYGTLDSRQMRKLAYIARRYDKGYGHFTTRQNIQYNWPKLEETPDILAELADGPSRRRVGLSPVGRRPVRAGSTIHADGEEVGVVTSGTFGPSAEAPVAMGYVAAGRHEVGTELTAEQRGRDEAVVVAALPFVPHRYVR